MYARLSAHPNANFIKSTKNDNFFLEQIKEIKRNSKGFWFFWFLVFWFFGFFEFKNWTWCSKIGFHRTDKTLWGARIQPVDLSQAKFQIRTVVSSEQLVNTFLSIGLKSMDHAPHVWSVCCEREDWAWMSQSTTPPLLRERERKRERERNVFRLT